MSDPLLEQAKASYVRKCPDCDAPFAAPDADDFLQDEVYCPGCGQVFEIDDEDRNFIIALLVARMERLERRTGNPFEGLGL